MDSLDVGVTPLFIGLTHTAVTSINLVTPGVASFKIYSIFEKSHRGALVRRFVQLSLFLGASVRTGAHLRAFSKLTLVYKC